MQTIHSHNAIVYFGAVYTVLDQYLEQENPSMVCILVDSNTQKLCLPYLLHNITKQFDYKIISIEAGEQHKNLATCHKVWQTLADFGTDRKSILINLGGGVVTDLGGFVACTYKRGIRYINIPTSLLAMVDASVGGKTGVDLGNLKNMVGVISEPQKVIIDPKYLKTLANKQVRSGFAEMLKHGLIQDASYWKALCNIAYDDLAAINKMIYQSVSIKNKIILEDPYEKNMRKYLNFGHTLGHAIESYFLNNPERILLHGEAVAIGMLLEAYISKSILQLHELDFLEISEQILKFFPKKQIPTEAYSEIIALMQFDKKNENGNVNFTLLKTIGEASYDHTVTADLLLEALDYYNKS